MWEGGADGGFSVFLYFNHKYIKNKTHETGNMVLSDTLEKIGLVKITPIACFLMINYSFMQMNVTTMLLPAEPSCCLPS